MANWTAATTYKRVVELMKGELGDRYRDNKSVDDVLKVLEQIVLREAVSPVSAGARVESAVSGPAPDTWEDIPSGTGHVNSPRLTSS